MKKVLFFSLILLVACTNSIAPKKLENIDIQLIPEPNIVEKHKGFFEFTENTTLVASDSLQPIFQILTEKFQKTKKWNLSVQNTKKTSNSLVFVEDKTLENEAYRLEISETDIQVFASSYNGYLYGFQTIRQLLPDEIEAETYTKTPFLVSALSITDSPKYEWRGLMLDVSRHFFPKSYIFKIIEHISLLKMNKLHLHLVDNEGWRVEIKKYPKLTEIGAWRVNQEHKHWNERSENSPNEKGTYGGFYTQEDIKEIVAYAEKYGVEVIPEIEIPAHTMSAIAAYPELSCHSRPIAVPSGGVWPITDIYCAGKESTFVFLENVLEEVISLFPSSYIHIGGDEATYTEWEKCTHCKKRISQEKLKNDHELQAYFIKRIGKFLKSKGKKLVGWDEIIEGGLPENAVVMNWRGIEIAQKAIDLQHKTILTSKGYIDLYQGFTEFEPLANGGYLPVSNLYKEGFDEEKLKENEKSFILGAQLNLWSEYIPNEKHSEYMIFPRILAFSEVVWSKKDRNWEDFSRKIVHFFPKLEKMNVNYAKSMYQVQRNIEKSEKNEFLLSLKSEFPNSDIRYLLNSENNWESAKKYVTPISLNETTIIQAKNFSAENDFILKDTITFHKVVGKKITFSPKYHKNYSGQGDETLTNVVRGSKNFHDKQWLAWLEDDCEITVDFQKITEIDKLVLGAMQNQSSGIYFPVQIQLFSSDNGLNFSFEKEVNIPYKKSATTELKNFSIENLKISKRFLKLKVKNLKKINGGSCWVFLDEIQVF